MTNRGPDHSLTLTCVPQSRPQSGRSGMSKVLVIDASGDNSNWLDFFLKTSWRVGAAAAIQSGAFHVVIHAISVDDMLLQLIHNFSIGKKVTRC